MSESKRYGSFDDLIYASMKYVGNRELEEYEAVDESIVFSKRGKRRLINKVYKRIRDEHLDEPVKESRHAGGLFKRIAVAAIVSLAVLLSACMCIEQIREAIVEFFTEWYDDYIRIETTEDVKTDSDIEVAAPKQILEYRKPKALDDYATSELVKNEHRYHVEYYKEQTHIAFEQDLIDWYSICISNCTTQMVEININGYIGVKTDYRVENVLINTIYWCDEQHSYMLSGNVDCNSLISIAKSIYN